MMVIFRAQRRELVILWVYIISVIVNMFKHLVVSFNIKELKALQGRKQLQWTIETTACERYPATYSH